MSVSIATAIPQSVVAGDTWTWRISHPDYPASAGWALSYIWRTATAIIPITSTASGDSHLITVAAADTAAHAPGLYSWTAMMTASGVRTTIGSGQINILPDPATATDFDPRTFNRRILDSIEAVIEGRATHSDLELELSGLGGQSRRIKFMAPAELIAYHATYATKVWREEHPGLIAPQITLTCGGRCA